MGSCCHASFVNVISTVHSFKNRKLENWKTKKSGQIYCYVYKSVLSVPLVFEYLLNSGSICWCVPKRVPNKAPGHRICPKTVGFPGLLKRETSNLSGLEWIGGLWVFWPSSSCQERGCWKSIPGGHHTMLGGGFKYFIFSPLLLGEDSHFD